MKKTKKNLRICSRGHKYFKTSDCPVCPICWPGYERPRLQKDFPKKMSAPALRAFELAEINSLKELTKYTELELLALHGVGPKAILLLKKELESKGLSLKK